MLDHDIIDGKSLGSELQLKNDDDSHVVSVERGAEHLTRKPSTRSRRWRSLWECFTGSGCPSESGFGDFDHGFGYLTVCHTACVNKCSEGKSQRRPFKFKSDPKGFDKS